MASSKRELVLTCARELFESEGFHATGVDRILEKAGVAKMTLYNNFGSKDLLIVEVLNQSSMIMMERIKGFADEAGNDPYDQILAIFRALGEWYQDPQFCGCMFQAAVAEFPDHDSEPAKAALEHHKRLTEVFLELCTNAKLTEPEKLSRELALLASGATCVARQAKNRLPADDAFSIAEILLERASK